MLAAFATHRLWGLSAAAARTVLRDVVGATSGWRAEATRAGIGRGEQDVVGVAFTQLDPARALLEA